MEWRQEMKPYLHLRFQMQMNPINLSQKRWIKKATGCRILTAGSVSNVERSFLLFGDAITVDFVEEYSVTGVAIT